MYDKIAAILLCGVAAACAPSQPHVEDGHGAERGAAGSAVATGEPGFDAAEPHHGGRHGAHSHAEDVPQSHDLHGAITAAASAGDEHAGHLDHAEAPGAERGVHGGHGAARAGHSHAAAATEGCPEACRDQCNDAEFASSCADACVHCRGEDAGAAGDPRPYIAGGHGHGQGHGHGEAAEHVHPETLADGVGPHPHAGHAPAGGTEPIRIADSQDDRHHDDHAMLTRQVGGGWSVTAMAQLFPIVTRGAPGSSDSPLNRTEVYVTQPAAMLNLESPGSRFTFRFTPNFEGLTLPDGELTFGGWGEGFIDSRHPHTLLHEMMASVNFWDVGGASLSLSAGRGFAPYGTDDPMSRPVLKYPTNHHLSQVLERWTVNAVALRDRWSLEAGIFGGAEPKDAYDLSNIGSFGDSWSARVTRRFGAGFGPLAPWELSASYAFVQEAPHEAAGHHAEKQVTSLVNAALRHAGRYEFGELYALVEGSRSEPRGDEQGYFSLLGESQLSVGRHQPYMRVEYATRPEYPREGAPGTDDFFRYDHDERSIGATRWLISSLGYGYRLSGFPFSARPFAEVNHHRAWHHRGPAALEPERLFGARSFWSLSAGFRIFLGGDPMRMGAYGVLDPMTVMHRSDPATDSPHHGEHETHDGHDE